MDPSELQKLMDCCRPDSDDLAEPELAALDETLRQNPEAQAQWQHTRQWDRALHGALHQVPVPDGLTGRLVAGLRRPESAEDRSADQVQGSPAAPGAARWTAAAVGLCAIAAAVALVMWARPWHDGLSQAEAGRLARSWLTELDPQQWRAEQPPVDKYPVDPSLRLLPVRWQRFSALGDEQAVAYRAELAPDRATAYLLVVRTRQGDSLPSVPPPVAQSTTEGIAIGAWKSRGLLYVLLVPGDAAGYRQAVDSQSFASWEVATVGKLA